MSQRKGQPRCRPCGGKGVRGGGRAEGSSRAALPRPAGTSRGAPEAAEGASARRTGDPEGGRGREVPAQRGGRGSWGWGRGRTLTILLRAGLGLGADSGSPRAGRLPLVVRRRRWRGLSPSIGAELGGCGGLSGEEPGEDDAPEPEGRGGRGGRRCLGSAPGPSAGGGLGPAALSHNCATRPAESRGAAASARTAPGRRGPPGRCPCSRPPSGRDGTGRDWWGRPGLPGVLREGEAGRAAGAAREGSPAPR